MSTDAVVRACSPLRESSNVTARRGHQWEQHPQYGTVPQNMSHNSTQSVDLRSTNVQILNSGLDVGFASNATQQSSLDDKNNAHSTEGTSAGELVKTHSNSYILSEAQGTVPEAIRTRAAESRPKGGLQRKAGGKTLQDSTYTVHSSNDLSRPRKLEKGE